jgi:hypothetical protein
MMNDVKSLIAGLVKEPGLLKNLVKDPQAIVRLAQLVDPEMKALSAAGCLMSRFAEKLYTPCSSSPMMPVASAPVAIDPTGIATGTRASQSVPLTGIMSLAAVAGAVVVVGVVSVVALSSKSENARH